MDILIIILLLALHWLFLLSIQTKGDSSSGNSNTLQEENTDLKVALSAKEQKIVHLQEKLKEVEQSKEEQEQRLTKEFENLANKILDQNSEKFKQQNREQLDLILNPLGKEIEKVQEKVEDTNKDYIQRNSALSQRIESLEKLNLQLSQDAINLTNALKGDSKTQGDWGEIQLEVLLEKSGLMKGVHFRTQEATKMKMGNSKNLTSS